MVSLEESSNDLSSFFDSGSMPTKGERVRSYSSKHFLTSSEKVQQRRNWVRELFADSLRACELPDSCLRKNILPIVSRRLSMGKSSREKKLSSRLSANTSTREIFSPTWSSTKISNEPMKHSQHGLMSHPPGNDFPWAGKPFRPMYGAPYGPSLAPNMHTIRSMMHSHCDLLREKRWYHIVILKIFLPTISSQNGIDEENHSIQSSEKSLSIGKLFFQQNNDWSCRLLFFRGEMARYPFRHFSEQRTENLKPSSRSSASLPLSGGGVRSDTRLIQYCIDASNPTCHFLEQDERKNKPPIGRFSRNCPVTRLLFLPLRYPLHAFPIRWVIGYWSRMQEFVSSRILEGEHGATWVFLYVVLQQW